MGWSLGRSALPKDSHRLALGRVPRHERLGRRDEDNWEPDMPAVSTKPDVRS